MVPRTPARATLPGLFVLLALLPTPGRAQDVELTLDGGLSHALPPPGIGGPSATYLRGGLRLRLRLSGEEGGSLFGNLAAGGSLDDEVGSWGWATLGGERSGRISSGLGWRVSLVGSGFLVAEPTRYEALAARLRPELHVTVGQGLLVAAARGGVARSQVGTPEGSVETDLRSAGGDLELRRPLGDALLRVGAGAVDGTTGDYATGWLGLEGRVGRAWVRGEIRGWRTPTDDFEATGSLRLSIELGRSLTGWLAGGRSDPDPLLGTPSGDFVASGVSWRVVASDVAAELPVRVVDPRRGRVAFRLEEEEAERVAVVGDFSGWSEVPLERRDGTWVVELTLEPGLYHYGFVVDGEWHVPEGVPGRTEDEWGRPTAVFLVPETAGDEPGGRERVTSGDPGSSNGRGAANGPPSECTECLR